MDQLTIMRLKDEALKSQGKFLDKLLDENRGYTPAERVQVDKLQNEIDGYDADLRKIQADQAARGCSTPEEIKAMYHGGFGLGSSTEPGFFTGSVTQGEVRDFQPTGYTTEHRSLAEFIRDVCYPTERRVMSMGVGSTGGFMIPDQLLQSVMMADPESVLITDRATTIPPNPNSPDSATTIPALDQSGANGVFGGVTMGWISEGGDKPETEPILREIKLEPQEIAGYVKVTDKFLRNGGEEANLFLRKTLGNALKGAMERAFISGTGVGMPAGITIAACRIEVPRAGALGITYQDLVDMVTVFGPDCWSKGFWIVSQSALAVLLTMADPGAGGTLIMKPADLRLGTPANLLGLPVHVSSRTPVLGATGDIMLVEPSYYLKKLGSGPFVEMSNGPYFTKNRTIVKIFANVDGQAWLTTPMTMEDGVSQLSPFVLLAAYRNNRPGQSGRVNHFYPALQLAPAERGSFLDHPSRSHQPWGDYVRLKHL